MFYYVIIHNICFIWYVQLRFNWAVDSLSDQGCTVYNWELWVDNDRSLEDFNGHVNRTESYCSLRSSEYPTVSRTQREHCSISDMRPSDLQGQKDACPSSPVWHDFDTSSIKLAIESSIEHVR